MVLTTTPGRVEIFSGAVILLSSTSYPKLCRHEMYSLLKTASSKHHIIIILLRFNFPLLFMILWRGDYSREICYIYLPLNLAYTHSIVNCLFGEIIVLKKIMLVYLHLTPFTTFLITKRPPRCSL